MKLLKRLNYLNYNHIRRRVFRREVEASFFSNKSFKLPPIPKVGESHIIEFKNKYPFNFYNNIDEYKKARSILLEIENETDIITEAEKIVENRYDLIGSGEIYLGDKINWHYDYKGNYEWKPALSWRENFFDFPDSVDIKFPWELARFHQAIKLGKAYLISRDERYTEKFLSLLNEFNSENPFCAGVNWLDSSEISIRLLNILFGFSFFLPSKKIDAEVINKLIEFTLHHSIFIENNLSYSAPRGFNYLSELTALAASGLLFKDSIYGKKNLSFARSDLEREIRHQIYKEGTSWGQSIPFHSIILECFCLSKIILTKADIEVSKEYNERLKRIFTVQREYMRNDFTVPQIGDGYSSRVIPFNLNDARVDYSFPLNTSVIMYRDACSKNLKPLPSAEVLFLFGCKGVDDYKLVPVEDVQINSIEYKQAGQFIFKTADLHFFIEAGEIGGKGFGAPGHNDTFTFELYYKSRKFIVDAGTFSYYDKTLRNKFRSVKYHNTICIDNELLSVFDGLFRIKEDLTKPKILEWHSDSIEDVLTAQHYAYTRLRDPVIIKRSFHFLKEKKLIRIKDEFFGGKEHSAVFNIHFHPSVEVKKNSDSEFAAHSSGEHIGLRFLTSADYFSSGIFNADFSEQYGKLETTKKIVFSLKENFPAFLITEITLL
jgi:hypothetical protein